MDTDTFDLAYILMSCAVYVLLILAAVLLNAAVTG